MLWRILYRPAKLFTDCIVRVETPEPLVTSSVPPRRSPTARESHTRDRIPTSRPSSLLPSDTVEVDFATVTRDLVAMVVIRPLHLNHFSIPARAGNGDTDRD